MTTHAVIHNGTAPASIITESLRDALDPTDTLALPWYGRPTEGLAAVYDHVLDNEVSFIMYHDADNLPAKSFRNASHGKLMEIANVNKALIKSVDVPGGKILFLWNEEDEQSTTDAVQFVFDHCDPKTLVLELTNGLAPISLSLAADAPEETPVVSPEAEVEADPEVDPTDSVDETEKFSKAELEIMSVPVLKRLAENIGVPKGVTGKANYIRIIVGEPLPEASFPPGERAEPEPTKAPVPETIADKDLTQPKPPAWNPATGDEAHALLRKSLLNQKPSDDQIVTIEAYREVALKLGGFIIDNIPVGRNRSLALTALEDTVMRGVKGILLD
jgi:hypothetical protein